MRKPVSVSSRISSRSSRRSGFEGAVRKLESAFSNRPEWVEDAVATAFERAVKRDRVFPSVDELKKWMYVVYELAAGGGPEAIEEWADRPGSGK